MQRTFICLVALVVSAPAFAGIFRHDRSNIQHIELGQDPRYQSVGRFNWDEVDPFTGDTLSFVGSGVLISPEWVLTAGHVVGGNDNAGGGISNYRFTIGDVEIDAPTRIIHHGWTQTNGDLFAGWDLGLVRLSQPVVNATPARLYTGEDELGRVGTIAGFGSSGTGLSGQATGAGIKRAGPNVIDAIGRTQTPGGDLFFNYDHDRLLSVDLDSPLDQGLSSLGSVHPLDLEYSAAPGDSGGGLFIDIDDETFVAGITSLGRTDFDDPNFRFDYGEVSSYVRVSQFIDWIEDQTGLVLDTPPLGAESGDFDGDGIISTEDYNRWLSELGRSAGILTADGNNDGRVDAADYTLWRDAYAQAQATTAFAVAVPEPSGFVLLAAASTLACRRCRTPRRAMAR